MTPPPPLLLICFKDHYILGGAIFSELATPITSQTKAAASCQASTRVHWEKHSAKIYLMMSRQALEHEELFCSVLALIKDHLVRTKDEAAKVSPLSGAGRAPGGCFRLPAASELATSLIWLLQVIEFKSPDELRRLVDFELEDEGREDSTILELCQTVLKYSVDTRKRDRQWPRGLGSRLRFLTLTSLTSLSACMAIYNTALLALAPPPTTMSCALIIIYPHPRRRQAVKC